MEEKNVTISEQRRNFVLKRYGFDPLEILKVVPGKYGMLVINMGICYQSLYKRNLRLFAEVNNLRAESIKMEDERQKRESVFEDEISQLKYEIQCANESHKLLLKTLEESNIRISRLEVLIKLNKNDCPNEMKNESKEIEKQNIRIDKLVTKFVALCKTLSNYRQELKKKVRVDKKDHDKIVTSVKKYNERLEDLSKFVSYSFKEKEKIKKEKVYLLPTGDKALDTVSKIFFWRNEDVLPEFIK